MGDDYELAFAAPFNVRDTIAELAQRHGIPITPIATLREDANPGASWQQGGTPVEVRSGYRHF